MWQRHYFAECCPDGLDCPRGDGWRLFAFVRASDRDAFAARMNAALGYPCARAIHQKDEAWNYWRIRQLNAQGFPRWFEPRDSVVPMYEYTPVPRY